ncbi:hypothetical protein GYD59_001584 [Salmonella enterica]|nr:hypothetical protein [Salmonella enterica]EDU6364026.1 hypothetical protein [Salmonella enterica subsp. enterica serovar Florian]EEH2566897.1 hypothetical protein [Salmonella enterica]EJH7014675.1 hypothetical protein [Salmonella enterica]EJH7440008.1 hypothetical protein [Salmonella enterica]
MSIEASFLTHPYDYNASLEKYSRYFKHFSRDDWNKDSCGGYFNFNGGGFERVLFFIYYDDGFSLRYDCSNTSDDVESCWYSVYDKDKMNTIVDADTEQFIPLGSCLPPDIALAVIEDFFKDPQNRSSKVEWVNADDLDWSSVY